MTSNGRILAVDDTATNLVLLSRGLEKAGYTVLQANSGAAALELAQSSSPDLILLDIMMPDQDGIEVCRILKRNPATATVPVIFVTARDAVDDVVGALEMGGSDYITKPFKLREVIARVAVHLRLRRAEQELLARNQELETLSMRLTEMNAELSRLTRTDPLTGLLNRRAWHEAAAVEEVRSQRQASPYSIVMADLDEFKRLNDSLGHQAGDECLVSIAKSLQTTCRTTDVVGRYGGEEFVVLASETDEPGGLQLAERLRCAIAELRIPHPSSSVAPYVTVSVGVATCIGEPWEQSIRRADHALYKAKHEGRNRVCVANADGSHGRHSERGAEPEACLRVP